MARHPFAFLVHPRADVRLDLERTWAPLGWLPRGLVSRLTELPLPSMSMGAVTYDDDPDTVAGYVWMLPIPADQMLARPRAEVSRRVEGALDALARRGVRTVTLGAFTSPATRAGRMVSGRPDLGVTTGNAFTAAMTADAVERLLRLSDADEPQVALVGATGSVGTCVARLLASRKALSRMTLIARTQGDLDRLQSEMTAYGVQTTTARTIDGAKSADIVVLLTSSPDALLHAEHLKEGAVVLDDTQPRNTSPTLLDERPDVTVVDGGVVAVTGLTDRAEIGQAPGTVYACMAESMLLALDGHQGDFALGRPTVEQAEHTLALAAEYRQYGFHLAPPHSFGEPLALDWDGLPARRRVAAVAAETDRRQRQAQTA